MSSDKFGKWWPCLRKHYKRTHLWLPRAKELLGLIDDDRGFRYFTLCARPMIDVYMLVKENVLRVDATGRRIQGVSFCELDEVIFPEMIELIGIEESGFLAKLEDLALFADIPETETLDTIPVLENYLQEEGEGLSDSIRAVVNNKRRHLLFKSLFPFDFLNLDFCDRYYGQPPDVMKINSTIDRLLEWQRQPGTTASGEAFSMGRFVVAITCRVDKKLPTAASTRLRNIVSANVQAYDEYRAALNDRDVGTLSGWASDAPLDFFMSAWPKEIAQMALKKSWDIIIHDHAFYDRVNDRSEPYDMVCLVVEFRQALICKTYLAAAVQSLRIDSRTEVRRVEPTEKDGKVLLGDLERIVNLRNEQAVRFSRELLPEPLGEIRRLRAEGVPL